MIDAAVHDSPVIDDVLGDDDDTAVRADSAYRSAGIEEKLENRGLRSRIYRKAHRNPTRLRVRARVEHVLGAQTHDLGGTRVRSIGIVRAKARIGLNNLI